MDKARLLTITVVILLLLNIGTLVFLFSAAPKAPHGPGPHRKQMPREIIIEKLHFDAAQVKEYDKLIKWHQASIRKTEDKIRSTKNDLYQLLNEAPQEAVKTALIDSISQYQKEIESVHFKHFQDIKKLCKKEQQDDFRQLTEELSKLFSRPQKRPHEE